MAINFDEKGNVVSTTEDGVIAIKLYSLEKQIYYLKSQLQQKENIIKEIKSQLNYLETYSSKEDVFEDMERRLDIIKKIIEGDSSNG